MDDSFDHCLETRNLQLGVVLVDIGDGEAKSGGEVLFVAEHDVDERSEHAINFLRLGLAANRLPQGGTVIQVVRNN